MIPGIPTSQMPIDTFNKQLNELFANMKAHQQQKIQREQLMQAMKFHADEQKYKERADKRAQSAEGRAQQTFVEKLKSLKSENELNDFLKQAMGGANSMPSNTDGMQHEGSGQQSEGVENPNTGALSGEHEVDMNGQPVGGGEEQPQMVEGNQQPSQPNQQNMEIFKNPVIRGLFKKKYGYDPLAPVPETAETKRNEEMKTWRQKEKEKIINGNEKEKVTLKENTEKDLPVLYDSLKAIKDLKKIASENKDLFGHWFKPELFAKTTKNKNAGTWQNIMLSRIQAAESKLSSKGNQLALKTALAFKPGFQEQQEVAEGKLDSMENEINTQIQHSLQLLGRKSRPEEAEEKTIDGIKYKKIDGEWHTE